MGAAVGAVSALAVGAWWTLRRRRIERERRARYARRWDYPPHANDNRP